MRSYTMQRLATVVLMMAVAGLLFMAALFVGGCVPSPNTKIDLMSGTYDSAKDIKLAKLKAQERGPDGQITRSVEIEGLDSSASSVIEAQAKAMMAQAETFKEVAKGIEKIIERIPIPQAAPRREDPEEDEPASDEDVPEEKPQPPPTKPTTPPTSPDDPAPEPETEKP